MGGGRPHQKSSLTFSKFECKTTALSWLEPDETFEFMDAVKPDAVKLQQS